MKAPLQRSSARAKPTASSCRRGTYAERVDSSASNKRVLEALVKCGALPGSRKATLEALEQIAGWGQKQQADRLAGQASIFDLAPGGRGRAEAPPRARRPTSSRRTSCCASRKRCSASTCRSIRSSSIRDQLRRKTDATIGELERRRDGEIVTVGGIVSALKHMTTKRGDAMVFMRLDDVTGGTECVVFNSTYEKARELCTVDRILVVKGRVDHKEGETKLIALELSAFEAVAEKREVRLKLDATKTRAGLIQELRSLIQDFPGESPVYVDCMTSVGPKTYAFGPAVPRVARARLLCRGQDAPRRGSRGLDR